LRRKRKQIEAKPTIERNSGSTRRASTAEENDKIDPNANHCLCNQPYDPKKFYIRCDICNRWFHGRCVKITEKQSKKMSDWSCNDCVNEQKSDQYLHVILSKFNESCIIISDIFLKEIYCVCKTPYDDKRFYVGCDGCQGWFHPECVGTTQMEVTKISEYLCPKCINNTHNSSESNFSVNSSIQLHRGDYKHLLRIYELLFKHRNSWPFREPVDQKKYPNYYQVIKKPMALSDVYNKMKELGYEYLSDFIADISQIFDNARMFNPKGSPIYNCAEILDKKFREEIIRMKGVYSETVHLGRLDSFFV
uniref:Histone acetyltransferase n=1 Tax=Dracunculus medinensis TaxID=318479 RepID=A0A0N4U2G0_DRAME